MFQSARETVENAKANFGLSGYMEYSKSLFLVRAVIESRPHQDGAVVLFPSLIWEQLKFVGRHPRDIMSQT